MRRTGALSICIVAMLAAGAVPASASQVVILKTKKGGVAQPGAPARLSVFVSSEVEAGCAEVTGSLAVNGKPKDKATFSTGLAQGPACEREQLGGELTGVVSAVEPTIRGGLVLKAPQVKFRAGECFYRLPPKLSGEYDPGELGPRVSTTATNATGETTLLSLHLIRPAPKGCVPAPSAEISFGLIEPHANEVFEAEFAQRGRARGLSS
jgi:hypothetical protein